MFRFTFVFYFYISRWLIGTMSCGSARDSSWNKPGIRASQVDSSPPRSVPSRYRSASFILPLISVFLEDTSLYFLYIHIYDGVFQAQNDDERQQQLRERARRLIAEVKMGVAVTPSQLNDDNNSDRRSIDDQNNSPRRSITPSTPGDRISIKVYTDKIEIYCFKIILSSHI